MGLVAMGCQSLMGCPLSRLVGYTCAVLRLKGGWSDFVLLASPVGLFLMVGWLVLRRVKESRFVGRLIRRGWAWWL